MTRVVRKRKAFSLVEMIAVTVVLAIIVIACTRVTQATSALRIQARNAILLTTHNLNVMEKLNQELNRLGVDGTLHPYYGFADDDSERQLIVAAGGDPNDMNLYRPDFSSTSIRTEVFVEESVMGNFYVYNVSIESKVIGYPQRLVSRVVFTNIGIEKSVS